MPLILPRLKTTSGQSTEPLYTRISEIWTLMSWCKPSLVYTVGVQCLWMEVVSKLFWITTSVWPFPEATCSTGSSSKSGSISWSNVFMCCRYLCFVVLESGFVSSQRSNTEIKFVQKWWSSLSGVAHGNFSSSFLEIYTERLTNCRLATLHLHVILDHTF
jgi:hypothetical protein